ncbi:MAG: SiaB family protein kinase [Bacteroidales bacterium]|nr:SiaB family protein kinase [Bacteroidales bacterium]
MKNSTVIDYSGIIQYETIGELIHTLKSQVHALGIQIGTYKRILLVMIEALENIMKHSWKPTGIVYNEHDYISTLSITREEHAFKLCSSNVLHNSALPLLRKKLDHLNSMNKQEIKDLYKDTITNGEFTNTGGAGLGLIEIVKITGNKIGYEFFPLNEACSRFTLYATIDESRS